MGYLEELLDVLASLNAQRVRAALTLLGVIIGVGTLVFLSSLLAGSEAYMRHGIQEASGDDILSISPRNADEATHKASHPLDRYDSRALATDASLGGAQVLARYFKRVRYGNRDGQWVYAVGTLPEAFTFYQLGLAKGRFIGQGDVWSLENVVVLGQDAAEKLLPGVPDPIGQEVRLSGERFRVIGLLAKKPSQNHGYSWTWDSSAIVPQPVYLERLWPNQSIGELVVKAPPGLVDKQDLSRMAYAIGAIVGNRHQGVRNFEVTDPLKQDQGDHMVKLIVIFLEVSIALVCLGVGGINIMNIMVVSVAQRTREIGIRRALGATKWSIQRQFLLEALLLSTAGGLLGLVGGNVLAWLLALGLTKLWGFWPFVMMPVQMACGLTAAVLTGVVFGWYPARRAAELAPVQCLRAE